MCIVSRKNLRPQTDNQLMTLHRRQRDADVWSEISGEAADRHSEAPVNTDAVSPDISL